MKGKIKRCLMCDAPVNGKKSSCENCGKAFVSWKGALYCSKSCKSAAYKKRQKLLVTDGKK